jgi:ribosomal protein S18 acetylase RimI-like enzyme
MDYRRAETGDAAAIAALHAESWRLHYRGAFRDDYLDGDLVTERKAVWAARLAAPRDDAVTIVADDDGGVVGFAHTFLDDDRTWGALLDNLHVTPALKRHAIGTRLVAETARAVRDLRPASGLYLWVLEQNTAAQAFYAARGGTVVERCDKWLPSGNSAPSLRVAWPDLDPLVDLAGQ